MTSALAADTNKTLTTERARNVLTCRNQATHHTPNWKFCEFKQGHPSVIFGAPESAGRQEPPLSRHLL